MLSSWCQWHFYIARATLRIVLKLVELWVVQNMTAAIKLFHIGVRIKIRKIYLLVCRRVNFEMSGISLHAWQALHVLLKLSTCKSSFCGEKKSCVVAMQANPGNPRLSAANSVSPSPDQSLDNLWGWGIRQGESSCSAIRRRKDILALSVLCTLHAPKCLKKCLFSLSPHSASCFLWIFLRIGFQLKI